MEKKISEQTIYDGRIIKVHVDEVELDDGTRSSREIVEHRGGVAIALRDDDGRYFMVRQYRYAFGKELLEFCAGKLEKDEDYREAVLRECEEELGYKADNLHYFTCIIPSCGFLTEKLYLFTADKGEKIGQHFDDDERIEVEKYSLEEIGKMILEGAIVDAKTIALTYLLKEYENGKTDRL